MEFSESIGVSQALVMSTMQKSDPGAELAVHAR
jgi:hypothetical protein